MIRLDHHEPCEVLSFQEERALPWITNSGGLSSNVNAAISFPRPIDERLLLRALHIACERHDAIRTRFTRDGQGGFRRRVMPADAYPVDYADLNAIATLDDPVVTESIARFCGRPFVYEDAHWFRVLLLRSAAGPSALVISMPHIVSDASSMRILIGGIWRDYVALARGETPLVHKPRFSLADFAGTQRAWGTTADFSKKLDDLTALVCEGITRVRNAGVVNSGLALPARPSVSVIKRLDDDMCAALEKVGQHTRSSLSATLMAAAVLALARLFGEREFCFRMPFANRSLPGTDDIVGFLSNDIPIFVSLNEGQELGAFIKSFHKNTFSMMRFGLIPWSVLCERLKAWPSMSAGPNPFDHYLINVFPAAGDLLPDSDYRARTFSLSLSAFTSNRLKVWFEVVNGHVFLSLKVGVEQKEIGEHQYMPTFLDVFERMLRQPDIEIGRLLSPHPNEA